MDMLDALGIYQTLEAPSMREMHGEFAGHVCKQSFPLFTLASHVALTNPVLGWWLGKAFRPTSDTLGRGYNAFRHVFGVTQRFPMQVALAPSRLDGRPAYHLVYRAYHSLLGDLHVVDELRRVREGLYLGLGTAGKPWSSLRRFPALFVLSGPVADYRGDIGRERASFELTDELFTLASTQGGRAGASSQPEPTAAPH